MAENPILRARRLALAAQVAAGGPARPSQLIRAGLLVPAADLAESGERRPSPARSAGPLVCAFAAATGREPPPDAWFVARGTRSKPDEIKIVPRSRLAAAPLPLPGTQGQDSRNAGR